MIHLDFLETFKNTLLEAMVKAITRTALILTGALLALTVYGTHQIDAKYFKYQQQQFQMRLSTLSAVAVAASMIVSAPAPKPMRITAKKTTHYYSKKPPVTVQKGRLLLVGQWLLLGPSGRQDVRCINVVSTMAICKASVSHPHAAKILFS